MHISNNEDPEWMSPVNAAKKFGVSRTTLYEWMDNGKIRNSSFREKHQRHGKRLINVQSLRAHIEAHEVKPETAEPKDQATLDS